MDSSATNLQDICGIAPGGAIMVATHKTKGAFEGAEGAICLNGSPGSIKSSFSSICVYTTYYVNTIFSE